MNEGVTSTDMETFIEIAFDKFIAEYEMDTNGSIEDMLYEFFCEGFVEAVSALDDSEGEDE